MKKIFLACTVEEGGKYYSFADVIKTGENLKPHLERHKNLIVAHLCETRKQADEIVITWNHEYRENGTYMFQYPF